MRLHFLIPSQILQFKCLSCDVHQKVLFRVEPEMNLTEMKRRGRNPDLNSFLAPLLSEGRKKLKGDLKKRTHTHSAQSMEKIMTARRTQRHIIHLVERCWAQELPFLYANQLRRCWMQVCMTIREISPTVPEGHFSPLPAKDNAQLYFACVCVSRCFVPQAVRTRLLVGDKNTIMRRGKYDFSNVNSSWAEGRQEMEKTWTHFIAP